MFFNAIGHSFDVGANKMDAGGFNIQFDNSTKEEISLPDRAWAHALYISWEIFRNLVQNSVAIHFKNFSRLGDAKDLTHVSFIYYIITIDGIKSPLHTEDLQIVFSIWSQPNERYFTKCFIRNCSFLDIIRSQSSTIFRLALVQINLTRYQATKKIV